MTDYLCDACSRSYTPETMPMLVCQCDHLALFAEPVAYTLCSACYWAHLEVWMDIDDAHDRMEKLH